jgi:hypothetical protein
LLTRLTDTDRRPGTIQRVPERTKMRYLLVGLVLLSGCIADNKTKQENNAENTVVAPIAIVEKSIDASGKLLAAQVRTEQANNNAQLSGMVTGMIHQMKLDFDSLIKLQATMTNTAIANVKTEFDSVVKASVEMRAEVLRQATIITRFDTQFNATANANIEIDTKLADQMKLLSDLQIKIGRIESQNAAAAAALVGYQNQFEQIQQTLTATAGRDVTTNYLPKEAVRIIENIVYMMIIIVTILCGVASTAISRAYKASRERAELRHEESMVENKRLVDIIVSILPRAAETKTTLTGTTPLADQNKPSG